MALDIRRTITVAKAAKMIGASSTSVRTWCRTREVGQFIEIPGTKTGYYLLSEAEVEWLKDPANRLPIGRPRKVRDCR